MKEESILFIIGVEGQFELARSLSEKMELPVIGIFLSQGILMKLTPKRRKQFLRAYSFPDFYFANEPRISKLKNNEIINKIYELEKKWGIESTTIYFYYDRYNRQEKNYRVSLLNTLLTMEFLLHILEQEQPVFVKGEAVDLFGHIMNAACVAASIPCLNPRTACVQNRLEFQGEKGRLVGWREMYMGLESKKGNVNSPVAIEALDWLEQFRQSPRRPEYADRNSRVNIAWKQNFRVLWFWIKDKVSIRYWKEMIETRKFDRRMYLREMPGKVFLVEFVGYELRAMYQRKIGIWDNTFDFNSKFIYVPLQFTPEISTLAYGLRYENQENFVTQLAQNIPSGYRLYVKEHTSMIGRRTTSFYRRLAALHNVEIVPPETSTFELMLASAAVATITSTAGWEAFLFGKPVIAFGDVFFREFDDVLDGEFTSGLAKRIKDYLDRYELNEQRIRNTVIAYFSATAEAKMGDIGNDTQEDEALKNGRRFSEAITSHLQFYKNEEFSTHHNSGSN